MTRRWFGWLALAQVVLLLGCGEASLTGPEGLVVRGGTSFGFCAPTSYCITQLDITGGEAVFTRTSRAGSELREERTLSQREWRDLVAAVDEGRLRALPDVIGCPDCADGGAEFIEVVTAEWTKRVTFEYNADVPGIDDLLRQVRALRDGFSDF
jgi:hypothetical protein